MWFNFSLPSPDGKPALVKASAPFLVRKATTNSSKPQSTKSSETKSADFSKLPRVLLRYSASQISSCLSVASSPFVFRCSIPFHFRNASVNAVSTAIALQIIDSV